MKRLGILTTLSEEDSYGLARFRKEGKNLGVKIEEIYLAHTALSITNQGKLLFYYDKPKYEVPPVIVSRIGATDPSYGLYVLNHLCKLSDVHVVNHVEGVSTARDKFRTLQLLAENGFRVPLSLLLGRQVDLHWAIKQVGGFPAIMKLNKGSFGIGVMLVESIGGAKSVFETLAQLNQKVMIQEYLASEPGIDYRVLTVGGKVLASMRRRARKSGEFRANIAQGGKAETFSPPTELVEKSQAIANFMKLDIAGIDFVYHDKYGFIPIEVNAAPQFEGLEKVSGVNVARAIIKYCVEN